MSASASASNQQTTNQQFTSQGGGAGSTTITGGGTSFSGGAQNIQSGGGKISLDYNDPAAALAAIQGAGTVIQEALENSNNLQGQVAQVSAAQNSSNSDLIQQVLAQEQDLAAYQGTNGGLGAQQAEANSSQYLIWGGIGLAALAALGVIAFIFKK